MRIQLVSMATASTNLRGVCGNSKYQLTWCLWQQQVLTYLVSVAAASINLRGVCGNSLLPCGEHCCVLSNIGVVIKRQGICDAIANVIDSYPSVGVHCIYVIARH